MASTIRVDALQDTGANDIITSDGSGTFTYAAASGANFTALDADNVSAGTLAIAQGGTGAATLAAAELANTPSFFAYLSGDQDIADSTQTKITLDTEYYDTDSAFASNKFTVPADEGGKYLFVYGMGMNNMTDGERGIVKIAVNGATLEWGTVQHWMSGSGQSTRMVGSVIRTLSATDYVELYGYQTSGGTLGMQANKTFLSGLKIIGA